MWKSFQDKFGWVSMWPATKSTVYVIVCHPMLPANHSLFHFLPIHTSRAGTLWMGTGHLMYIMNTFIFGCVCGENSIIQTKRWPTKQGKTSSENSIYSQQEIQICTQFFFFGSLVWLVSTWKIHIDFISCISRLSFFIYCVLLVLQFSSPGHFFLFGIVFKICKMCRTFEFCFLSRLLCRIRRPSNKKPIPSTTQNFAFFFLVCCFHVFGSILFLCTIFTSFFHFLFCFVLLMGGWWIVLTTIWTLLSFIGLPTISTSVVHPGEYRMLDWCVLYVWEIWCY